MIEFVPHHRIDRDHWEAVLDRCTGPVWYGRSEVLDAACPAWDALVDRDGDAVMPLTHRERFGVRYLYQPFTLQQLGVFSPHPSSALTAAFLEAVEERFPFADIYLRDESMDARVGGWTFTAHQDLVLDLADDPKTVERGYRSNLRRILRAGLPPGTEHDGAVGSEEFLAYLEGSAAFRSWRVAAHQVASMRRVMAAASRRGEARIEGIRTHGKLVAAGFFVHAGERTIFLKGLASPEGRTINAMHQLMHAVIRDRVGRDRWFDMAGSDQPGLARFYRAFGARPQLYLQAVMNRLPPLVGLAERGKRWWSNWARKGRS